jgi:iron complex outermembrane recepter protein
MFSCRRLVFSLFVLTTMGVSIASEQAASTDSLEEIVVTAEKRSESVLHTSIAITALSQADLQNLEIHDTSDLQEHVPSLSITNSGLTSNINIRGIGLNVTTPSVVSGVAVYRDNLFQAPLGADETLYDVASLQVLRGPQGTFVGSNSTGGALFINTANPSLDTDVHGYAQAQGGDYRDHGVQGAINLPVTGTVAARLAFNYEARDSYWTNRTPNAPSSYTPLPTPGDLNTISTRGGLLWKPSDQLQILTKAEYFSNDTGGFATQPIPGTAYAPYAPHAPFNLAYAITDPRYQVDVARGDVEATYVMGDSGITLRSVTGGSWYHYALVQDQGASIQPSLTTNNTASEHLLSQEFDVTSDDSGRLRWVAGVFAFDDPARVRVSQTLYSGFGPATVQPQAVGIFEAAKKQSFAGFGGVRIEMTDTVELQLGARYTKNKVNNPVGDTANIYLTASPPGPPGTSPTSPLQVAAVPMNGSESDQHVTWKAALNWTLNSDNYLYAFAATGSKAGGIQTTTTNFKPEYVTDYEIGWKASALNNHVHSQIGAFHNKYTDFQLGDISPATGANTVFNAGAAKVDGVEAQVETSLSHWLINLVGSYVHSSLTIDNIVDQSLLPPGGLAQLPQCPPGKTTGCIDYTPYLVSIHGAALPYAPQENFTVDVGYHFDITSGSTLTPRAEVAYTASQYSTVFGHEIDVLRSRTLVNSKLLYENSNWSVELYGNNLTNRVYPTGRVTNAWFFGDPRNAGIRVRRQF